MWVRCYKTPEICSISACGIPQSESDTSMQKGYYYSREHTFVRAGSSGEDSNPLLAASHDVAESLKGNIQCTHVSASSAWEVWQGSQLNYHVFTQVVHGTEPRNIWMGAWWFERSSWLMTHSVADRNVLCKAGEQAGGPDRCSPAPLFKRFLQTLMLFGHRALAELDGSLRLG